MWWFWADKNRWCGVPFWTCSLGNEKKKKKTVVQILFYDKWTNACNSVSD